MSAALLPSWAWPSVSFKAIGSPLASTSAWIFVVDPPHERPMHRLAATFPAAVRASSAPPFTVGGMLMHADGRGVDHLHVARVGLRNLREYALPYAEFAPSHKPVIASRRRARSARGCRHGEPARNRQ